MHIQKYACSTHSRQIATQLIEADKHTQKLTHKQAYKHTQNSYPQNKLILTKTHRRLPAPTNKQTHTNTYPQTKKHTPIKIHTKTLTLKQANTHPQKIHTQTLILHTMKWTLLQIMYFLKDRFMMHAKTLEI